MHHSLSSPLLPKDFFRTLALFDISAPKNQQTFSVPHFVGSFHVTHTQLNLDDSLRLKSLNPLETGGHCFLDHLANGTCQRQSRNTCDSSTRSRRLRDTTESFELFPNKRSPSPTKIHATTCFCPCCQIVKFPSTQSCFPIHLFSGSVSICNSARFAQFLLLKNVSRETSIVIIVIENRLTTLFRPLFFPYAFIRRM